MASPVQTPAPAPLPTVPTVEAWRAMPPTERLRLQVEINAALTASTDVMGQGQPHRKAVLSAIDALGLHFKAIGRTVYLADDLAILYPGEKPFSPDILVVLDVAEPEDDERLTWVVADEGKGPDLVIEVVHKGDRDKDLVANVERYAHLGIPEYFVYDRLRQQIHGYRLVGPGAARYQRILPQFGHYRSGVLGLDLALINDKLRFLSGEALLPVSADVIGRLQGMIKNLEVRAHQAQVDQALAGLRESLLTILDMREIPCPDAARARIEACADPSTLRQWLAQAKTATSVEEVFSDARPTT